MRSLSFRYRAGSSWKQGEFKARLWLIGTGLVALVAIAIASCTPASPKESGLCPCPGCCGAVSK